MFLFVSISWLLAQLVHPFMFLLGVYLLTGESLPPRSIVIIFIFSAAISSPCLLFGWLFLSFIVHAAYIVALKFLFWLLTSAALIVLIVWIGILIIGDEEDNFLRQFLVAVPAIISIWTVSILRFREFRNLIYKQTNTNNENDMV